MNEIKFSVHKIENMNMKIISTNGFIKYGVPLVVTLINIGSLVFNIFLINWISDLEKNKCDCSRDWKRDFIKHWLIFTSVLIGMNTIAYLITVFTNKIYLKNMNLYSYVVYFVSILNLILSIMYIKQLKDSNCECSNNELKYTYYIYSWVILVLNIPVVFITLYLFFTGYGFSISRDLLKFPTPSKNI